MMINIDRGMEKLLLLVYCVDQHWKKEATIITIAY